MLEVRELRKTFGGFAAVDDVSLDGRARRDHRHHRPQRRRQDDPLQPDHRPPAARQRATCSSKDRDITGIAPHKICRHGHRPLVPAHQHLLQAHRVREHAGRVHRPPAARHQHLGRLRATIYRDGDRGAARAVGLLDKARHDRGRARRTATRSSSSSASRSPASPRSCCSTSRRPACRGQETRETIRAARAHRQGARADPALHRARHGGGVLHRPAHRRAAPGPDHRRRARPRRCEATPRCAASTSEERKH